MAQPNSLNHVEAVAPNQTSRGDAIRVKTTAVAYRCMMQAHKMLKPTQSKRSMNSRR